MTDVEAVDLLEHLPLLGADAAEHILQRLPEETVGALRELFDVEPVRGGAALTIGALLVGAGISGGLTWLFAKKRFELKYREIADDEIEEMRAHYRAKTKAAEGVAQKGAVEAIVTSRGYSTPSEAQPPMAVQPPASVVAAEDEQAGEPPDDSAMATNAVEGTHGIKPRPNPPEVIRNVFQEHGRRTVEEGEWDWHAERSKRSPDRPYIVHTDERLELEYEEMTLTYYSVDDVVCNDRDEIFDMEDRELKLGEANLLRFGHGSGDPSIVYIRNDTLELVFEVVLSPNSFSEEVHGFAHDSGYHGNLERMRARERDEQDED